MSILEKIRNLSETKRKIILWSIVAVVVLVGFFFYIKHVKNSLKKIKAENFKERIKLPDFGEKLKSIGIEEEIKKFEKEFKNIEKATSTNEKEQSTTTE